MAVAMDSGCWRSSPPFGGSIGKKRGWGDNPNKLLQLMIGQPLDSSYETSTTTTLDLLGSSPCSSGNTDSAVDLKLDMEMSAPSGWEKRLDLKLGRVYYVNLSTGKSTYNHPIAIASSCWDLQSELDRMARSSPRRPSIDLKLDLALGSPAITSCSSGSSSKEAQMPSSGISTIEAVQEALKRSVKSPSSSSASSSHQQQQLEDHRSKTRISEESSSRAAAASPIVLTGCKRCLMYVMLTRNDPRCPKCGSSVVLDVDIPSRDPHGSNKKPKLELELL